jgi:hypothetical protein
MTNGFRGGFLKFCVGRAHVGRGAPESEQRAIAHARQARPQLVKIEIGFQRNPG